MAPINCAVAREHQQYNHTKTGTHSSVVFLEEYPPSGIKKYTNNVSGAEYAPVLR
jgi:hypothetical protein